jgi:hypothetical protein
MGHGNGVFCSHRRSDASNRECNSSRRAAPGRRGAAAPLLPLLALLLAAAAAGPRPAAAAGVDILFQSKPQQLLTPWTVTFSWSTPGKTVWPSALVYTATGTGVSYFTVSVTRGVSVTSGSLSGTILVTRTSGETSGGSDKALTANQPAVELWQAATKEGPLVRIAGANCIYENSAATFTFNTPGTSTVCTYTFAAPFPYDPEAPGELRVAQVTFSGFPAATGFPAYPLDAYGTGSITSTGRCANVFDTMTFATSADKPTPFSAANVAFAPFGGSPAKPPAQPSSGVETCGSVIYRYTATFPSVTCSGTAFAVGAAAGGGRGRRAACGALFGAADEVKWRCRRGQLYEWVFCVQDQPAGAIFLGAICVLCRAFTRPLTRSHRPTLSHPPPPLLCAPHHTGEQPGAGCAQRQPVPGLFSVGGDEHPGLLRYNHVAPLSAAAVAARAAAAAQPAAAAAAPAAPAAAARGRAGACARACAGAGSSARPHSSRDHQPASWRASARARPGPGACASTSAGAGCRCCARAGWRPQAANNCRHAGATRRARAAAAAAGRAGGRTCSRAGNRYGAHGRPGGDRCRAIRRTGVPHRHAGGRAPGVAPPRHPRRRPVGLGRRRVDGRQRWLQVGGLRRARAAGSQSQLRLDRGRALHRSLQPHGAA